MVPFWVPSRCRILIGTQRGTIILTTTHMWYGFCDLIPQWQSNWTLWESCCPDDLEPRMRLSGQRLRPLSFTDSLADLRQHPNNCKRALLLLQVLVCMYVYIYICTYVSLHCVYSCIYIHIELHIHVNSHGPPCRSPSHLVPKRITSVLIVRQA